ncbi:AroM family protein [Natrialba sp. PRR66]|uniref:AroM family protein n=1 Tax=Natrialba sp. PRR66 TaxID=3098146 RepID=UPI002B1E2F44|nr:AroM family protein [Natrialba sp. PRR66]
MSVTLGLVTIGQAPRTDVTPDIRSHLPDDVEVVEVGALDRFNSTEAIEAKAGPTDDEPVYVTRLRSGDSVTIDREATHKLTQERVREIEADVDTIGLLCTGSFPDLSASVPVLEPSELLHAWATGIVSAATTVGVLIPKPEQFSQTHEKWGTDIEAAVGSPYDGLDAVVTGAIELGTEPDLVVLDCIGYTPEMKREVARRTDASVLLARSVLRKTATELL